MALAGTGHCLGRAQRPVRGLKVFHAFLLEWVKSISSTDSIHRSRRFLSRQDVSSFVFEVGIYTTSSQQECIVGLVACTVPSGNVLPATSTRDGHPCGRVQQFTKGRVRRVLVGGGAWEGVSS